MPRPEKVPRITVTAAVIERAGAFLLTKRLDGTHLAGHWEFPGGKCVEGESLQDCLIREIREELDASITVASEMLATTHAYPERIVDLHFFRCQLLGEPRPMLGQQMAWVSRAELQRLPLPPADDELVKILAGP